MLPIPLHKIIPRRLFFRCVVESRAVTACKWMMKRYACGERIQCKKFTRLFFLTLGELPFFFPTHRCMSWTAMKEKNIPKGFGLFFTQELSCTAEFEHREINSIWCLLSFTGSDMSCHFSLSNKWTGKNGWAIFLSVGDTVFFPVDSSVTGRFFPGTIHWSTPSLDITRPDM